MNSGDIHFIFGGVVEISGLVIAHDGDDSYYAVVFNSTFGLMLFQVVEGSWGSSLKEVSHSIGAGDYVLRASYRYADHNTV